MIVSLEKLEKIQTYIDKVLLYFAGILSFLLMLLITVDVICRAFSIALLGVYEAVQIIIVAIVFLGIPYVQSVRGHIFIDIVTMKLSNKVKVYFDLFGLVIGIMLSALITWQSGMVAFESVRDLEYASGIIPVPVWPAKIVMACSFFFLTTRLILDAVTSGKSLKESRKGNQDRVLMREGESI